METIDLDETKAGGEKEYLQFKRKTIALTDATIAITPC